MEITQKTYWSKTSIVVTVLVGALMAGMTVFLYYMKVCQNCFKKPSAKADYILTD